MRVSLRKHGGALTPHERRDASRAEGPVAAQPSEETRRPSRRARVVHALHLWTGLLARLLPRTVVTFTQDGDTARIVVFKGAKVVDWATLPWPAPDSAQAEEARNVLTRRRGGLVVDLPAQSVLLRRLQLPKSRHRFLDSIVKTELEEAVPFSQDEVDTAWYARRDKTGYDVTAFALPKKVMDDHIGRLRNAGLRPRAAYGKATALAFATGAPVALAVHLDESSALVVFVRDEQPHVVHRVDLPGGSPTAQRVEAVARAAEYVESYAQSADGALDSATLPLFVSGALAGEEGFVAKLEQALQRDVARPSLPFACPPDFPAREYGVNLGLALAHHARVPLAASFRDRRASAVSLLPQRFAPKALPLLPIAVFSALTLLAAVAVQARDKVSAVEGDAAQLSVRLESRRDQDRLQRLQQASVQAVQRRGLAVEQIAQKLETQLAERRSERQLLLDRLGAITTGSTGSVLQISGLTLQGGTATIAGTAADYQDVLLYTDALRESGTFGSVTITRLESTSRTSGAGEPASAKTVFLVRASAESPQDASPAKASSPTRTPTSSR
ncbi:MAG: hypothetical protein HYX97_01710 [Chloroflexi bacterium]|nr:hypothetical protein [Chloroflexota bacterium]